MASPTVNEVINNTLRDVDSDYGSDFSLHDVERLLSPQQEHQPQQPSVEIADIENNPIVSNFEYHESQRTLRLPRVLGRQNISPLFQAVRDAENIAEQINTSIEKRKQYPDLSDRVLELPPTDSVPTVKVETDQIEPPAPDIRSPLERFRTAPRKPLSVTDLVSPAWCELQYWYTLTKHGRKKRTPAMKQGSAVHKALEDQVHRTVRVDVQTKEDAWGLRIWNVIQGLRTLRETGQTRELEVWGTVDGLVVNGVIDELNYICPDTELEESARKKPKEKSPASDQTTISDFFKASRSSVGETLRAKKRTQSNKLYICDVKTRSVRTVPNNASFRPTQVQLMLYHHLLSSLAINAVDFTALASRYDLDTTKIFSDAFIAQVGSLNDGGDGIFYDAVSDIEDAASEVTSQDSTSILLAHNNLTSLWSFMISEFQLTLPDGAESLGMVLKAEYRSRDDGEIVGSKTILMDEAGLKAYLNEEMQWWKGEREAKGVAVEEAFKCRSCDFADGCEWRLQKVEEATEKSRLRKGRRKTSVV